jgi:hypothetical protein
MKKGLKKIVYVLVLVVTLATQVIPVNASTIEKKKSWSGSRSAAYAKKYATSPNSKYHTFSSDCTNFASQCLFAGNKYMQGYTEPKKGGKVVSISSKWYYFGEKSNTYACSTSWVRCSGSKAFVNYWYGSKVGTFSSLANVRKNVSVGDVIQITLKDGTLKHSIIVSEKSSTEIRCASHTSNYSRDTLAAINKRATKSWGKLTYTVFHFK